MSTKIIYKPVNGSQNNDSIVFTVEQPEDGGSSSHRTLDGSHDGFDDDDDGDDEIIAHHMQNMEISSHSFDDDFTEYLFSFKDPWLPSVLITLCLSTPLLAWNTYFFAQFVGTFMVAIPFLLHLLILLWVAKHVVGCKRLSELQSPWTRIVTSVVTIIDTAICIFLYRNLWSLITRGLFIEIDGTTSTDWIYIRRQFSFCNGLTLFVVAFRTVLGINAVGLRTATASMDSSFANQPSFVDRYCNVPSYMVAPFLYLDSRLQQSSSSLSIIMCSVTESSKRKIRERLGLCLNVAIGVVSILLLIGFHAAYQRLMPRSPPQPSEVVCDPMDPTECFFPFPSFHFLREDPTSVTGYRVHLLGEALPPMRSGKHIKPSFLNELDGFSTMGPIMFYLDGLKEAHESGVNQLRGPEHIADSITQESVTFLLHVNDGVLVPHSAEIDYLDTHHPSVLVFPAHPLRHNDHYAMAVINAKDRHEKRLPQSSGLYHLMHNNLTSTFDPHRHDRYSETVVPALEQAIPWWTYADDPTSLQLLFDFHTISAESQLGNIRRVRDATMARVASVDWDWNQHVRTIRVDDLEDQCGLGGSIARRVHAELDVPWFLTTTGSGSRYAVLDATPTNTVGTARFLVNVPCSLKFASLRGPDSQFAKPLRAVMEYGHGLFGHRGEANDDYLGARTLRLLPRRRISHHSVLFSVANKEGYLLIAMDWRGMSTYDLPNVIQILLSAPDQAQALRDNLIQGYASKYALLSFSRSALLSMDWLRFADPNNPTTLKHIPTLDMKTPTFVFYGVSQGGILGAGYTALSGKIGLIDRAVLTAAGTPFAFIMTRSLDFKQYDTLLLLNYFNNRHVRFAVTLIQMAWDTVEASGVLAPPLMEPFPPVLLQAGIGDPVVSELSTEFLARAFNASLVPENPLEVFGLKTLHPGEMSIDHTQATLVDLFYVYEYARLPHDNTFANKNSIHFCVRSDLALIQQLTAFVNAGIVLDPCAEGDQCHRSDVVCHSKFDRS